MHFSERHTIFCVCSHWHKLKGSTFHIQRFLFYLCFISTLCSICASIAAYIFFYNYYFGKDFRLYIAETSFFPAEASHLTRQKKLLFILFLFSLHALFARPLNIALSVLFSRVFSNNSSSTRRNKIVRPHIFHLCENGRDDVKIALHTRLCISFTAEMWIYIHIRTPRNVNIYRNAYKSRRQTLSFGCISGAAFKIEREHRCMVSATEVCGRHKAPEKCSMQFLNFTLRNNIFSTRVCVLCVVLIHPSTSSFCAAPGTVSLWDSVQTLIDTECEYHTPNDWWMRNASAVIASSQLIISRVASTSASRCIIMYLTDCFRFHANPRWLRGPAIVSNTYIFSV